MFCNMFFLITLLERARNFIHKSKQIFNFSESCWFEQFSPFAPLSAINRPGNASNNHSGFFIIISWSIWGSDANSGWVSHKKLGDLIIFNIKAGNKFLDLYPSIYILFDPDKMCRMFFSAIIWGRSPSLFTTSGFFEKEFHESSEFFLFQTLIERNAPNNRNWEGCSVRS